MNPSTQPSAAPVLPTLYVGNTAVMSDRRPNDPTDMHWPIYNERQQCVAHVMGLGEAKTLVTACNAHQSLVNALEACLDVMQRAFPNDLPVQQGTLCEEQDWDTSLRLARAALLSVNR